MRNERVSYIFLAIGTSCVWVKSCGHPSTCPRVKVIVLGGMVLERLTSFTEAGVTW